MKRDDIHIPARMQIILGNSKSEGDRELMRRVIEQVMIGEYENRTEVVRHALQNFFQAIDARRQQREKFLRQED